MREKYPKCGSKNLGENYNISYHIKEIYCKDFNWKETEYF